MQVFLYNYLLIPEGVEIINTKPNYCNKVTLPKYSYSTPDKGYKHFHEIKIGEHRIVDLKEEVKNGRFK